MPVSVLDSRSPIRHSGYQAYGPTSSQTASEYKTPSLLTLSVRDRATQGRASANLLKEDMKWCTISIVGRVRWP